MSLSKSDALFASLSPTGRLNLHVTHSFPRAAVPPFAFNRKEHRHHAYKMQEPKLDAQSSGEDVMSTTGSGDSLHSMDQLAKTISPLQSIGDDSLAFSSNGPETLPAKRTPGDNVNVNINHPAGQGACFFADFSTSCFAQFGFEEENMGSGMADGHYNYLPHRHSVLDETLSGDEADFQYHQEVGPVGSVDDAVSNAVQHLKADEE